PDAIGAATAGSSNRQSEIVNRPTLPIENRKSKIENFSIYLNAEGAPLCPSMIVRSKISALGLIAFDRFEQGLEISLAERLAAATLNNLEEERRAILHRLGEDLEHV